MNKEELIQKLVKFQNAFNDLSDAFDEFEYKGKDCNDYIVKNYPFNKSFDELNYEVSYWVMKCVERLSEE